MSIFKRKTKEKDCVVVPIRWVEGLLEYAKKAKETKSNTDFHGLLGYAQSAESILKNKKVSYYD